MAKRYTRVHRLLKIISLIQGNPGLTPNALAEKCEVHVRTIYRDVDTLNVAGIPCGFDEVENGYQILPGFFMPPVDLTTEEALALIGLVEQVSRPANVPFMQTAALAAEKIRSQLPKKVLDTLHPLDSRIHIKLARGMADDSPHGVYIHMRNAISSKRAVKCRYDANTGNGNGNEKNGSNGDGKSLAEAFIFKPYALWYCQRAWYVIGHHDARNAIRQLKLNRFTFVSPTDKPYAIPDDFSLDAQLGHAWRMIRGDTRHNVAIRFTQPFAETVSETRWHPTQEEEWSEDGKSVTLRFTVDGLKEIVWWVLGYGPGAEVLEPPELKEQVRQLVQATAEQYARPRPDGTEPRSVERGKKQNKTTR